MKSIINLFAIALLMATTARADLYGDLESAFQSGELPGKSDALGTWAGRCVGEENPTAPYPALYSLVERRDSLKFPPNYLSQTIYWETSADSAKFEKFSGQQLNNYGPYKTWLASEQWQEVVTKDDMLVNELKLGTGVTQERAVRRARILEQDYLLVRLTLVPSNNPSVRYCYFEKRLAAPATGIFFAETGLTPGGNIHLESAAGKQLTRRVRISHAGPGTVVLRHVSFRGEKYYWDITGLFGSIWLNPNTYYDVNLVMEDSIDSIDFHLNRRSDNIRVTIF